MLLGTLVLQGIRRNDWHPSRIDVFMEVNEEEILKVKAEDVFTKGGKGVQITFEESVIRK